MLSHEQLTVLVFIFGIANLIMSGILFFRTENQNPIAGIMKAAEKAAREEEQDPKAKQFKQRFRENSHLLFDAIHEEDFFAQFLVPKDSPGMFDFNKIDEYVGDRVPRTEVEALDALMASAVTKGHLSSTHRIFDLLAARKKISEELHSEA